MKQAYLVLFVAVAVFLSSCKDELPGPFDGLVVGCTDLNASNYNSKANDNCCCTYEGNVSVWMTQKTQEKIDSVSTKLFFYLNGEKHGESWTFDVGLEEAYGDDKPGCSDGFSTVVELGEYRTDNMELSIYADTDPTPTMVFSRNIDVSAYKDCTTVELTY